MSAAPNFASRHVLRAYYAATIVFLSSPKASWVSGAMLLVDGVQHKGVF